MQLLKLINFEVFGVDKFIIWLKVMRMKSGILLLVQVFNRPQVSDVRRNIQVVSPKLIRESEV
jgi:hypothetical protein